MANIKSLPSPEKRDLLALAQQLRAVKAAEKRFLSLWMEQTSRGGVTAVNICQDKGNDQMHDTGSADAMMDALNHDWSNLYRGSVLDD